MIPQIICNKTV